MFKNTAAYVRTFTLVHVSVYWVVGSLFYQISGYEEALATMEVFQLYRPLESISMVLVVFFGQIGRGALLSLLLYPFFKVLIQTKRAWLLMFGLLLGLQVLGSPLFADGFISAEVATVGEFIESLVIGIPEIVVQTLVLSLLFVGLARRQAKTAGLQRT